MVYLGVRYFDRSKVGVFVLGLEEILVVNLIVWVRGFFDGVRGFYGFRFFCYNSF